jgi:hypothetical protein
MPPDVVNLVTPPSSPDLQPAHGNANAIPPIKSGKRAAVHLFSVTTIEGSLHARMMCWDTDTSKLLSGNGFAPVGDMLRSYMDKAHEINKQFGVIPHNLRYDLLTARFFSDRPSIYEKVLVKLKVQKQQDPAKTKQLKTIAQRTDISDAEKLNLASALV